MVSAIIETYREVICETLDLSRLHHGVRLVP
jgi:hypothetical protein